MPQKYTESELSRAILMIIDEGMPLGKVAEQTGINLRALQRYKRKYVDDREEEKQVKNPYYPSSFIEDAPVTSTDVQKQLDDNMLARVKFLDDVFYAKRVLLKQLVKEGKKSKNIDALQRSIKTLNDIEKEIKSEGDTPPVHAGIVN